jgi:hypothetical protein
MTTICESTQAVKKEEEEVITSNEIRLAIRRAFPNQTGKMIIHQVSIVLIGMMKMQLSRMRYLGQPLY